MRSGHSTSTRAGSAAVRNIGHHNDSYGRSPDHHNDAYGRPNLRIRTARKTICPIRGAF